ncbi:MAG TPA: PQQ-binding-like beta-propeller repeat protein [Vicinamibacterales bacterium]|nr:PQQ-binding-like beta-propeller repeat protein [Vicinamibacterales bacterium]
MQLRSMFFAGAVAGTAALLAVAGHAQKPDRQAGDWPMYAHDLAGTKFSPLKQITAANAGTLQPAWNLTLVERPEGRGRGRGAAAAPSNPEVTPIAVNGVVYLLSAGNRITALDGATGKELWRYQIDGESTGRGVAYWPGDRTNPERILFTASAVKAAGPDAPARLMALDAATGKPSEGFGTNGVVEIGVGWNGVPVVFRNLVLLGATVGEVPDGPSGDTRAFDARDGKKLWEFHTVPQPGELGHETWLDDGWKHRSGVNIWGWYMTADVQRGILYMPIAGPAANYWGGDRPGNNLFANSIVAVDANTGKYKWHFQTVHHDLWDSDMPSPPTLVDITQNGRTIPALASVGKTGYMFILNRETGKPIFGVEERPVPKGDVPGEWYSPTQPFPVKPPPLVRVEFNKDRDMVRPEDTSADHVAACEALLEKSGGFYNAGPFTPFLFHEDGAPPKSTIQFPGGTGGVNWGGPAADPNTGFVYVNAHDTSLVGWIEKKKPGGNYGRGTEGSKQPYDRASVNGPGPYFSFSAPMRDETGKVVANLPCQRPPWARLVAVNANTGDVAWQVPLGLTEALPEGKRHTGGSGSAGPIVTAGGIVIVGAATDRRIRAFDAKTGAELWAAKMPGVGNANPITYQAKNGKQYIAIVATDSLQVFSLP